MQPTTPASGWAYLWNNGGAMGNPANYTALLPTSNTSYYYDADGVSGLPGAGVPAGFVYLGVLDPSRPLPGVPGGHPGTGSQQAGAGGIERFAIAAYTLQSSGIVSLVSSHLTNEDTSLDGVHLQVYVGNSVVPTIDMLSAPGLGSSVTFDGSLGLRNAGDTIYVGVGANGNDFFDTFRLQYSIDVTPVPEPGSLAVWSLVGFTIASRFRRTQQSVTVKPNCSWLER